MAQRISAIDHVLAGQNYTRIYTTGIPMRAKSHVRYLLDKGGRLWRKLRTIWSNDTNQTLDVHGYVTPAKLERLMQQAQIIYVHSLFFLQSLSEDLFQKYGHKIFVDLHGCVVEEAEFNDAPPATIARFQKLEAMAFAHVKNFVSVSDKMTAFYKDKYKTHQPHFITLPIFNDLTPHKMNRTTREKPSIIYSGGVQKWQNIDKMTAFIQDHHKDYDFTILTPAPDIFKNKLGNLAEQVEIQSVPSAQVADFYQHSDCGFILRDRNIVNEIACPTKMIEYIQYGLVPIVLQPEIGDFNQLGYRYIQYTQLQNGTAPSALETDAMRTHNYSILQILQDKQKNGQRELLSRIKTIGTPRA